MKILYDPSSASSNYLDHPQPDLLELQLSFSESMRVHWKVQSFALDLLDTRELPKAGQ